MSISHGTIPRPAAVSIPAAGGGTQRSGMGGTGGRSWRRRPRGSMVSFSFGGFGTPTRSDEEGEGSDEEPVFDTPWYQTGSDAVFQRVRQKTELPHLDSIRASQHSRSPQGSLHFVAPVTLRTEPTEAAEEPCPQRSPAISSALRPSFFFRHGDLARRIAGTNTRVHLDTAAACLSDMMLGNGLDFLPARAALYRRFRARWVRTLLGITVVLNLSLALFQTAHPVSLPKGLRILQVVGELWCMAVFVLECGTRMRCVGWQRFRSDRLCLTFAAATAVHAADLLLLPLCFGDAPLDEASLSKISPRSAVRPVFVVLHFAALRNMIPNILKTAVALIPVVMFIAAFVSMNAVFFFLVFRKANTYFDTFFNSLYYLFVGLTSANFPDILLPGWVHPTELDTNVTALTPVAGGERWTREFTTVRRGPNDFSLRWLARETSPVLFVLFYIFGTHFLISVAFGVVFDIYKKHLRESIVQDYEFRQEMVGKAFDALIRHVDDGYDQFNRRWHMLGSTIRGLSSPGKNVDPPSEPADGPKSTPGADEPDLLVASLSIGSDDGLAVDRTRSGQSERSEMDLSPASTPRPSKRRSKTEAKAEIAELSAMLDGLVQPGMQEAQAAEEANRERGIDLYVFTLLCEELEQDGVLSAPNRRRRSTRRPHSSLYDTLCPGALVTLLRAIPLPSGEFIEKGMSGVVRAVPGSGGADADVDFRGALAHVREGDIELVHSDRGWDQYVRVMFHCLDRDGSGVLCRREFMALYQMLQLRVSAVRDNRIVAERAFPPGCVESACCQRLLAFARSSVMHWLVNAAALGSVALGVVHFETISNGSIDTTDEEWYHFMLAELFIAAIFVVEVVVKALAADWSEFWGKKWHRFDCIMSVINIVMWITFACLAMVFGSHRALLMVTSLEDDPKHAVDSTPIVLLPLLLGRLIRCLRLATDFRPFRHILKTFMNIMPMFSTYLVVGLLVLYIFALVGVAAIGDARPHPGTAFAESDYYALNFGSMWHALVTLFCLTVVSNWHLLSDGYRTVCGDSVIIYFVLFWMVTAIVLVNIVTAFVIEVWSSQWQLNKASVTCVTNHPLARRVLELNKLTADDSDYLLLALKPGPTGRCPRWRVTYARYSHKVQLALEHIFLGEQGITHVLEGGGVSPEVRSVVAFRRLGPAAKVRVLQLADMLCGRGSVGSAFSGRRGEGKGKAWETHNPDVRMLALQRYLAEQQEKEARRRQKAAEDAAARAARRGALLAQLPSILDRRSTGGAPDSPRSPKSPISLGTGANGTGEPPSRFRSDLTEPLLAE
eukprot:TRINITY_DN70912_c0_g1_i1.p1 TRINITY_DN70912_c0_g1~~TRINITY_DN70912_c0_g1_i1.p1  ORF type:complete len:1291 (+),score=382.73 TRINITY_DN70912_c0_g1_i1:90-3962(+)